MITEKRVPEGTLCSQCHDAKKPAPRSLILGSYSDFSSPHVNVRMNRLFALKLPHFVDFISPTTH
jgi:hypothetical protein